MGIWKVPRVGLHLFFVKCKIVTTDLHYLTHMDNLHKYSLVLIACVGDGTSGKHSTWNTAVASPLVSLFPLLLTNSSQCSALIPDWSLENMSWVSHSPKMDTMGRKQRQILPMNCCLNLLWHVDIMANPHAGHSLQQLILP